MPSSIFSCSSQERLLVLHNKHGPNLRASEQPRHRGRGFSSGCCCLTSQCGIMSIPSFSAPLPEKRTLPLVVRWAMSEEEGHGACGLRPQSGTVQGQPRFKGKGASLRLLVEELQGPASDSIDAGRPGTLGPQSTHPRALYTLLAEGGPLSPPLLQFCT